MSSVILSDLSALVVNNINQMRPFQISFLLLCFPFSLVFAQQFTLSGTITDAATNEPLIGAAIIIAEKGIVSDFNGQFKISMETGLYTLSISYVGYDTKELEINLDRDQELNIQLESNLVINEVVVTADIAIERETPVAFSNIPTRKLEEELASQDLPMILNSTPGAYATQSGGGDGDARISIRGFNQRNVAVMLDGIPVNDMENGWVYWSNWFGLDLVTQTMQVQRGLGASKLSVPSVGGTINILTKGIESKRSIQFKQEFGNDGYLRSTLGITTGRLKNGWGVSAAGSYKQGDGWVKGNFTKGYFYYLRIDKQFGNQMLSLSGFGAPQEHGQRPFTYEIGLVDTTYAKELGVPQSAIDGLIYKNKGLRYNEHWGYRDGEVFNTRKNYYHKPQFSLRHSWQASKRFYWSNVVYLSLGSGGGTSPGASSDGAQSIPITPDGQYDIDKAVENNKSINFAKPDDRSEHIIRSSNNDHFWTGLLSTVQFNIDKKFTLSGGLDGRYYRGDHYRTVYDLLGGSYFRGTGNYRIDNQNTKLVEGDKFVYDNSGFVRWVGLFGLLEYKHEKWSAFVNISGAMTGYSLEDYMKPMVVNLPDTSFYVSYSEPVEYNGTTYTIDSPEAKNQKIDWINLPSYTFKTGAAYNINESNSVFFNTGYLSKAQRFNNVINSNNFGTNILEFNDYDNEKIIAFELGYSYKSPVFSANINAYYTIWENKPLESPPSVLIPPQDGGEPDPDGDRITVNIPGIDALHRGIELDFAVKPVEKLTIEGLASIADWIWNSGGMGSIPITDWYSYNYNFDAKGVHVGDAAQLQLGGLVRYEPVKSLYFTLKGTWFSNNYANFNPEDLNGDNARRESWQMPDYAEFSFHTGYNFKIKDFKIGVRGNILNILNTIYLTDALNNDSFNAPSFSDFDAKSASVHYGQGTRWNVSFQVDF